MRVIYLTVLGLLLLGCLQFNGNGKNPLNMSEKNMTDEDIGPFLRAGCVKESPGYLDCSKSETLSGFRCFGDRLRIDDHSLYLEPTLILARCDVDVYHNNITEKQMNEYFYCGGGMLRTCTNYIVFQGNDFVFVKNIEGLSKLVAPISSDEEALAYVLLSKDVNDKVERDLLGPLQAQVEEKDGGYLVTAYHHSPFGCYDRLDYYEVAYFVSLDGLVEERSRNVAYTKNLGYMICVD